MSLVSALRTLWALFLVTFPFGYRVLVFEPWSYRFGNFNPWVSGFLYLPEGLLVLVFAFWILLQLRINKLRIKNYFSFVLPALFFADVLIVSRVQGTGYLGGLLILRLLEAGMIYVLLASELLSFKRVARFLLLGAGIQLLIALSQFGLNHSVGLGWLGESAVAADTPGAAKWEWGFFQQLRAYGTFLHPNILAGYFLVIYFGTRSFLKKRHRKWLDAATAIGLLLAFSRAALLAFAAGWVLAAAFGRLRTPRAKYRLESAFIIFLFIFNFFLFAGSDAVQSGDASFSARLQQVSISRSMALSQPLGVGEGGFTLDMERYSPVRLAPWDFQPVHNVYFLILNQFGIQGFIILLFILYSLFHHYSYKKAPVLLMLILFLATFDHFWITSWAGLMLIPTALYFQNATQ